ncbi:MAG: hypothetical protein ACOYL5_01775 [Phototrophicaceae bacterium]
MSIHLNWEDAEKTVLRQTFDIGWTLQAYAHSLEAVYGMTATAPHPVRLLMDLHCANKPAHSYTGNRPINDAELTRHLAEVVLVYPGHFMPDLGCPFTIVETLEDAYAHLHIQPDLVPQ